MPADSFEKTNLNWQVQQLRQQVGEWLELAFSNTPDVNLTIFSLPPWLIKAGFWLILGLFLSWLVWQLSRYIEPYLNAWQSQAEKLVGRSTQVRSVELTAADWVRRSQAQQKQGNYREACRSLYMAMLQHLNDANLVPHQTSRTDGEYLQLVRDLPQSQPYQILIATHEQLYFGNAIITPTIFQLCQQAYQEIKAK